MQDEHHQFLGLAATRRRTRYHDLVQIEAIQLSDDLLEIMGVIILPVDDDDVFLPPGDHQVAIDEHPAVAGA